MALQEILKLKEVVKQLLQEDRTLADNSKELNWKVWEIYLGREKSVISKIIYKRLPSEETIQRARRRVEEKYPELRGDSYNERRFLREEVRENITEI